MEISTGSNSGLKGDVNNDGIVDIVDVMTTVNVIVKKKVPVFIFENGDINLDGIIDVVDLMEIVYITLH